MKTPPAAKRREVFGNCELYLGDCYEIIPALEKVDAIVSDPPYGMNLNTDFSGMEKHFEGAKGGNKYERIVGDDQPFDPSPFIPLSGQFALFGADYYIAKLPPGGSLTVWDKRNETLDRMFGSCYETLWFYPARRRDIIRYKWAGVFGTEKEDIKRRIHPTQKPVALMKKIILYLRNAPGVILDPFMGSGSTGMACVELGRRFIGIEINENYFDIACKRIETAALQGRLDFEDQPIIKEDIKPPELFDQATHTLPQ
jgi:DNA modification methylase